MGTEYLWGNYLVFGLLATLAMTVVMYVAVAMGLPLDLTWMLGLVVVSARRKAITYAVGFVLQFVNGALFGLFYGGCFVYFGLAGGLGWGLAIGLPHGIVAGLMLGVMSTIHPRLGRGEQGLAAPGYFGRQLSVLNPAAIIILHLIYGGVFGLLFGR